MLVAQLVLPAPQVPLGQQAQQAQAELIQQFQAQLVPLVLLGQLEQLVHLVLIRQWLVQLARLERQDLLEQPERRDHLVLIPQSPAQLELPALLEQLDLLAQLAQLEQLVQVEQMAQMVLPDRLVPQELRVLRVLTPQFQDQLVQPDLLEQPEPRVQVAQTA